MLKFLARFPRFNGFLLGILQGIPQGIVIPDLDSRVLSLFSILDKNLVLIVCFGFFVPLVYFALVVAIRGAKRSKFWTVFNRYANIYDMMVWVCFSFAAAGYYALNKVGIVTGYGVCVLLAAHGVGFLIVGILENRIQNKHSQKNI